MPTQEKPNDPWTDEELILAYGLIARQRGRPYRAGRFRRPGWNGELALYVFWCEPCRMRPNRGYTVTHLAGYEGRLECSACKARFDHLLPTRRAKDAVLNPHRHPWFIAALVLAAILFAIALR